MSECQVIDCCPSPIYTYGLTGVLTPGPPIIVDPVPVYRLMFFDDFNGENGGIAPSILDPDWTAWLYWENFDYFTFGSDFYPCDLVSSTMPGYPGGFSIRRLFVHMLEYDNNSSAASLDGLLQTKQIFTFTPGTYRLSFYLAGSQNGQDTTLQVQIGTGFADPYRPNSGYVNKVLDQSILVPVAQPFSVQVFDFFVTSQATGKIKFFCHTPYVLAGSTWGPLIDDVKLEQIE